MGTRIRRAMRSAGRRLRVIALTGSIGGAVLATVVLGTGAQASTGAAQLLSLIHI